MAPSKSCETRWLPLGFCLVYCHSHIERGKGKQEEIIKPTSSVIDTLYCKGQYIYIYTHKRESNKEDPFPCPSFTLEEEEEASGSWKRHATGAGGITL